MSERFFTVPEAAAILKISAKTLYKLTASRAVPFTRPGGGKCIRFTQDHLDAIAAAGEQSVIQPPTRLHVAAARRSVGTHPPAGPSTPPPPSGPKTEGRAA